MPLKVQRSTHTRKDQRDIWFHIAFHNVAAADRVLDRLDTTITMLAKHPDAGRRRDDLGHDIRAFPVANHLICYRAVPGALQILRILHTAQDISSELFED